MKYSGWLIIPSAALLHRLEAYGLSFHGFEIVLLSSPLVILYFKDYIINYYHYIKRLFE